MDAKSKKEAERHNAGNIERYPLSPSGIGKCALKLARDVAHYHGVKQYPKPPITAKLRRIFARGNVIETSLIQDIKEYTDLKPTLTQQRVHLFDVVHMTASGQALNRSIEGDIDTLMVSREHDFKILTDFKSKGSYYSSGFGDSTSEFFGKLLETGLVEDLGNNCYLITDIVKLVDLVPAEEFMVDYYYQLNAYAFSEWVRRVGIDGVALYYENKNTCVHYELRWIPDIRLFDHARNKFQYIFDTVFTKGPEAVQREFIGGSARCRLCEYNGACNPAVEAAVSPKIEAGVIGDVELEKSFRTNKIALKKVEKAEERILLEMEKKGLTHIITSDGLKYEKKFLKSPKPHFELRLCK